MSLLTNDYNAIFFYLEVSTDLGFLSLTVLTAIKSDFSKFQFPELPWTDLENLCLKKNACS
jgi:hypothetical protein